MCRLLFALQQGIESGKRTECYRWLSLLTRCHFIIPIPINRSRVLVVMAEKAQQFPVAAISGIVIVVVILMMNSKLTKSLASKFTPTLCTDPREKLESTLPIGFLQLCSRIHGCHVCNLRFYYQEPAPVKDMQINGKAAQTSILCRSLCRQPSRDQSESPMAPPLNIVDIKESIKST